MGKTIEELFKTKVLADGKTAEQKYDIRNSKDLPISANTTVLLEPTMLEFKEVLPKAVL